MIKVTLLSAFIGWFMIGCAGKAQFHLPSVTKDVKPPILLNEPELIYPQEAKQKGLEGEVRLLLNIKDLTI